MTARDGLPCWADGSTSGLVAVALPVIVREVVILADYDWNRAGKRAARTAAQRWLAENRSVQIAMPPDTGADFNDMLSGKSATRTMEADDAA